VKILPGIPCKSENDGHTESFVPMKTKLHQGLLNSGPFIKNLLHNHSVIYKIIIFFFRRSKRQRNF
jgi:hypothetical protein